MQRDVRTPFSNSDVSEVTQCQRINTHLPAHLPQVQEIRMGRNLAVLVLAFLADPSTGVVISPSYHAVVARRGSVGLASTTAYPTLESATTTPAQKSAQTQTRSLSLSKPLGLVLAEESTGSLGAIVKDVSF